MRNFFIAIFIIILIGLSITFISGLILTFNKLNAINRITIVNDKQTAFLKEAGDIWDDKEKNFSLSPENKEKEKKEEIVIYAVGDIMLDRGVKYMIYKYGEGDYKFPFQRISEELKKADIVFGNLESLISDQGRKIGTVNSFRVEPEGIEGLKFAGFDILSVANNHSFDYDIPAFEDSLKHLKNAKIDYVGGGFNQAEAFGLKTIEINGTKIGFLAYCSIGSEWWRAEENRSGIAFISSKDVKRIKEDIKKAKEKVDVLIVSSHAGTEYQESPNDWQEYLYRSFIETGADLVLGHHPHVIQPLEGYPPGWIAYSLGNFIFDQGFSENTMKGMLLEIIIKDKKIEKVKERRIRINDYFQAELVE